MKALLLAGGLGTRLRPLTYTRPKHLLPIANRPHIEHVFDLLLDHGITDVVLLTSYLADAFAEVRSRAEARGMTVQVTFEETPLGTAGAIRNAEAFLDEGTFVVFNADILTSVDLSELIAFHREREAEATLFLVPVDDPSAYGVVPTERDGRVLGFVEKPPRSEAPTNLINAGVYVMERSIVDRIPPQAVWSAERQLFPELVSSGNRLFATSLDAYWTDIGTPEKYLQANLDALAGRFPVRAEGARDGCLLAAGAEIASSARLSSACVGPDAVVAADATVERSVLLRGAVISERAQVSRSIIGERARIASGVALSDRTVADGELIGG